MKIYTDGSYNRKLAPKMCGYGAVIVRDETPEHYVVDTISGVYSDPEYVKLWNVGGEILAVLFALDYIMNEDEDKYPDRIDIYYDYQGIEAWPTGKWKAKNEITAGYAKHMQDIGKRIPIYYHKVKGHSNDKLNDLADACANKILRGEAERNVETAYIFSGNPRIIIKK